MKLLLLPSITLLILVLNYNLRKHKGSNDKDIRSILEREDAANATRRKDISGLPYIKVPFDILPLDITLKDEKKQSKIAEYRQKILELSEKPMLNLIGISNTELKEQYGPANLEQLTICDQNYSTYIRTLYLIAECIYEEHPDAAVTIGEYCLSIGTDISGTYDLLGRYYLSSNDKEHFMRLYEYIPDQNSIAGKTIVHKLDDMEALF